MGACSKVLPVVELIGDLLCGSCPAQYSCRGLEMDKYHLKLGSSPRRFQHLVDSLVITANKTDGDEY